MLLPRRRALAALITAVSLGLIATGLSVAPAQAAIPGDGQIKINEVESNNSDSSIKDFVELTNIGATAVDISGWLVTDNDDSHTKIPVPSGTTLQPGGFYVVTTDIAPYNTGLGAADSARLFAPDGTTLEDSYSWTSHASQTYSRCPNGTGSFIDSYGDTPGAPNACSPVVINEVSSNPTDWVELYNVTGTAQDISGWDFRDNQDSDHFAIPAGTTIPAHGYYLLNSGDGTTGFSFGLGSSDSARLFTSSTGTLIDSFSWTAHGAPTWGRCYDALGHFVAGMGAWANTVTATPGAVNDCAAPVPPTPAYANVKINEVVANGDAVGDWVELVNKGTSDIDISGWKLVDSDPAHAAHPVVVAASTTLVAGGYYSLYTEHFQDSGFGLDTADSLTLYLGDGTTQVDTTSWTNLTGTSWGRCPDASGSFAVTSYSTRNAPNACSPIRINEIQPDDATGGPDWIELYNTSPSPVDISGYKLKDNKDTDNYAIPAGTTIAAHGFWTDTELDGSDPAHFNFGLGAGGDSVRLYDPTGTTLLDSYTWTAAPDSATSSSPAGDKSYGRFPDGTGAFLITDAPTFGTPNSHTHVTTTPWPGSPVVDWADDADTWTGDLSGLAFDPNDPTVLWGAQNKAGTLWKLVQDPSSQLWVPATGWETGKDPHYANGSGHPDTEGIGFGPDGAVYLASERDNDNNGVSRASVLRYDQNGTGSLNATDEWNLSSTLGLGNAQANLGLEGVTWVPDSYLTAHGFVDQSTGQSYNPSSYPGHGTGLFFVAVENNGDLYAFALNGAGTGADTFDKIATIPTDASKIADVNFNTERQSLFAVCDDSCAEIPGALEQLTITGGDFTVSTVYDRPQGMPDYNNEGFAIAPQSSCTNGTETVLWSDDGDDEGHSLRSGSIDCTALPVDGGGDNGGSDNGTGAGDGGTGTPQPPAPLTLTAKAPVISGTVKVGKTVTAATAGWTAGTRFSYQWFLSGKKVQSHGASKSYVLPASAAGKKLTVTVVGSKSGYTSETLGSAAKTVASGSIAVGKIAIAGSVKVGKKLTAKPSGWTKGAKFSYQWYASGKALKTGKKQALTISPSLVGKTLKVKVTAKLAGYATASKASGTTKKVAR